MWYHKVLIAFVFWSTQVCVSVGISYLDGGYLLLSTRVFREALLTLLFDLAFIPMVLAILR